MSPLLSIHIAAGAIAITAGTVAALAPKGARWHRAASRIFGGSMLAMATLGAWLALFTPPVAHGAPPQASVTISVLTLYLVVTAWSTVRHGLRAAVWPEAFACAMALTVAATLILFGVESAINATDAISGASAPYFLFSVFALIAGALDLRAARRGPLFGPDRIARHLWRMLFALFFACAFFFLGQQKVMPAWMHGSPILEVIAVAPLLAMAAWLFRIRATVRASR